MPKNPLGTGEVEEDDVEFETSESLVETLPTKYDTMSDLLSFYGEAPGVFDEAIADVDTAMGESSSLAERAGDERAYQARRAGAGVGSALTDEQQERLFRQDAAMRQEAAQKKIDLRAGKKEAERLELEKTEQAREELEQENRQNMADAAAAGGTLVQTWRDTGNGEGMMDAAFIQAQSFETLAELKLYLGPIWAAYEDMEAIQDMDIKPWSHVLVEANLLAGRPPFQGLNRHSFDVDTWNDFHQGHQHLVEGIAEHRAKNLEDSPIKL